MNFIEFLPVRKKGIKGLLPLGNCPFFDDMFFCRYISGT